MPSEQIVLQCKDCPMFSPSDVQETCRHPDGGLRRIDYDEMDEIPRWCPLRSGSLTISIRGFGVVSESLRSQSKDSQ